MEVHTVDSKGGQTSKLPSALGVNLTRKSEMKESSKAHAVPKLVVLEGKSIVSELSISIARWTSAKRLEDTEAMARRSAVRYPGVAAAQ